MPSSDNSLPSFDKSTQPLQSRAVYKPPVYYQMTIGLLKPLYRMQVWRRSHKRDNYQQEVEQRFGKRYPAPPMLDTNMKSNTADYISAAKADENGKYGNGKKVIWCHAVSLGETNTVAPLLDALLAKGYQIWLTNTTQTGFARGASRFADDIAQGRLSHSYVPVDSPAVIERFLAHVQPVAALFVETELWANILTKLSEHHIPSILVNGRLSAASFKSYQKIGAVSTSMMKNLSLIIAQDNDSAKRFRQLGAHSAQIRVAGSLKWVINTAKLNDSSAKETEIENDAEDLGIVGRPIWVAASTHSGEEETVLSWQQQILSNPLLADTLLIIVPRHPERFDEVAGLIEKSGLAMARRSDALAVNPDTIDGDPINPDTIDEYIIHPNTHVYLADSMGELMTWYALADVALVGGSLVDVGGHNPVEPASVGTPVLMGAYTQSCQSVVDKLASVGTLYQPHNAFYSAIGTDGQLSQQQKIDSNLPSSDDDSLLYQQLQFWLSHLALAKQAGQAGAEMTQQQQAVLNRQLSMIEDVIQQYAKPSFNQDVNQELI
ncbi:3-deoxy-D-manno-octulosonic acid transferase [Psychrobacter sp. ANT_WB68]|uniref:3-deoxy-D-manno-octulosonic acid transferase n=1 Tax=Psychrobacter sp. ANT_WB68 TaxID=2597355 RepID=UPI0011F2E5F4|nr:3-deoxy-D-manno-octulosonic acid transferase [Psychrobacter sp. ANT_WB68]KAA0914091.1 3-deoxy-D-manno-octulosonic acid transferase [Psychrobacter sp. ANT_WB68]